MAPCAPLRLLSQRDLGGGVVVLEPAGLGLLLDGEREGGRLSLSLYRAVLVVVVMTEAVE